MRILITIILVLYLNRTVKAHQSSDLAVTATIVNIEKAVEILSEIEPRMKDSPYLGQHYLYLDSLDKTIEILENPTNTPLFISSLGIAYARDGQSQKANQQLERLRPMVKDKPIESLNFSIGQYYSGLGQVEETLDWLEQAYQTHDTELYWLQTAPVFKPLYGHPRYEELLKKIGFPE